MDYIKEYRRFISSHYLSDAVRITVAILLPALLLGYYGHLDIGLSLAIGALCVSLCDIPGPIHHRRNGLLVCNAFVFTAALLTGLSVGYHFWFAIFLPVSCFFFSMIGIYGSRATSIGVASILIIVLETEHRYPPHELWIHCLWLLAGGSWYILLSLILHAVRPYRMIQQVLGEYVMATSAYLRSKAAFYEAGGASAEKMERLLRTQAQVQEKQELAAEMIFKTRSIIRESTHTSRVLMMVFLDVNDLLERAMSTHQDYDKLHLYFDPTGILDGYHEAIGSLADELDKIGLALQRRTASVYDYRLDGRLVQLRKELFQLRDRIITPDNVEGFIHLRHILDSIDDITARIRTLHQYSSYDTRLARPGRKTAGQEAETWVARQAYDPAQLIDNLTLRSNLFRHSLRITLAAIAAWGIGLAFPLGHSYWILLTVIVILKPAYGLTRQRNIQRLSGTLIGVVLAAGLLYLVNSRPLILFFLAISMVGAYSFMRRKYLVSVVMITLYVLILFRLLDERDFGDILRDRVLDTAIGSALAFAFSSLLPPVWERANLAGSFGDMTQQLRAYYMIIARIFTGQPPDKAAMVRARKHAGVSLANFTDAFNRMLSEPKSKQFQIEQIHRLVVAGNMGNAHVATLSYYAANTAYYEARPDYEPVIRETLRNLEEALYYSGERREKPREQKLDREEVYHLEREVELLMNTRKQEIEDGVMETETRRKLSALKPIADQFYFIYKISRDIKKISGQVFPKDPADDSKMEESV